MKLKTIVSCIVMCILILIGVQVNAALEASAIANCNSQAEPGDTITLDLSINVTEAGTGVEAIMATIEYPEEILEMSTSSVTGMDLIPDGNDLIIAPDDPITSGSKQVAKIKFTVKEDTTATSATIKISEISVVDGDGTEKSIANITKTVSIGSNEPVEEVTLTEIIITPPSKTTIKLGENLDVSSMKVTAKYSDGSTKDITSSCKLYWDGKEVSTLNGQVLTEGTHTVKAVYEGKEASFTIKVEKASTTSNGGGSTGGSATGGSLTNKDKTTASTNHAAAGLEILTVPGIIIALAIAVISYKKYKVF